MLLPLSQRVTKPRLQTIIWKVIPSRQACYLCSNIIIQTILSQRNINCNLKHTVPVRLSVVSRLQPARCQFQLLLVILLCYPPKKPHHQTKATAPKKQTQKRSLAFSNEISANFIYLFSLINQFIVILCYYGNGSLPSEPFSFNMETRLANLASFEAVRMQLEVKQILSASTDFSGPKNTFFLSPTLNLSCRLDSFLLGCATVSNEVNCCSSPEKV